MPTCFAKLMINKSVQYISETSQGQGIISQNWIQFKKYLTQFYIQYGSNVETISLSKKYSYMNFIVCYFGNKENL